MATNDLKKIRHKMTLPMTVNGPDWYCETIESLAVEVEALRVDVANARSLSEVD